MDIIMTKNNKKDVIENLLELISREIRYILIDHRIEKIEENEQKAYLLDYFLEFDKEEQIEIIEENDKLTLEVLKEIASQYLD